MEQIQGTKLEKEVEDIHTNTKSLVNINKTYLEEIRDYIFTMKRIMIFWFILTLLLIGWTIYTMAKMNLYISSLKGY